MKNIQMLNKISPAGTELFDKSKYALGTEIADPDAILVRSAVMHEMTFGQNLLAIGRAGAGVNNIPVDACADQGIVVFNTPGANANGVKELTVCALLLAARNIVGGIEWAKTLDADAAKAVEKGKAQFAGTEIKGKTLGVIGLGAIGGMVANAALALGMKVIGCDPFLSVDGAWNIDKCVKRVATFDEIYKNADYITLHVPATKDTKGMINADNIAKMKDGAKLVNLARADLINAADVKAALETGKLSCYVTDFPTDEVIGAKGVIAIPHLGASTEEAEDNCAAMAAEELMDYIENGNIRNSVNMPALTMPRSAEKRVCVISKGNPDILAQVSGALKTVAAVKTAARGDFNYTVADVADAADVDNVKALGGVIRVRVI